MAHIEKWVTFSIPGKSCDYQLQACLDHSNDPVLHIAKDNLFINNIHDSEATPVQLTIINIPYITGCSP